MGPVCLGHLQTSVLGTSARGCRTRRAPWALKQAQHRARSGLSRACAQPMEPRAPGTVSPATAGRRRPPAATTEGERERERDDREIERG